MKSYYHESQYRTNAGMQKLKGRLITICGAGALGANLAESLARSGVDTLRVIDRDRIEQHNLSTQPYQLDDVGAFKATILSGQIYRAVNVEVETICKELNARNVPKMLKGSELVVDCFDNSPSRRIITDYCEATSIPCLHAGLADSYAEIIWNEAYTVPGPNNDDICDYPLARNLVTMAVSIASETVIRYLIQDLRENWSLTFEDMAVKTLEL